MKKYLSLAAVLGALAFFSVSFLAQAQPETSTVETVVEKALRGDGAPAVSHAATPEVAEFVTAAEACEASVAVAFTSQASLPEAERNAFISCMTAKGYSEEEVRTRYLDHQTEAEMLEETQEDAIVHN